ncbi:MAG: hypothetical protein P8Z75_11855, partial [Gammaproteobacteria bacterium]
SHAAGQVRCHDPYGFRVEVNSCAGSGGPVHYADVRLDALRGSLFDRIQVLFLSRTQLPISLCCLYQAPA